MPKEAKSKCLSRSRLWDRLKSCALAAAYTRGMPRIPKRHTNAVFLGDLRVRPAGQITLLERSAGDVAERTAAARWDLEAIDRVIRLFDAGINPAAIRPIGSGRKIPPGSHGGFMLAIRPFSRPLEQMDFLPASAYSIDRDQSFQPS